MFGSFEMPSVDERFMLEALKEAEKALEKDEVPWVNELHALI